MGSRNCDTGSVCHLGVCLTEMGEAVNRKHRVRAY